MNFFVKAGFIAAAGLLLTACSSHSSHESQGSFTDTSFNFFSHAPKQKPAPLVQAVKPEANVKGYQVSRTTAAANEVLINAMGLVGTPYRWGGESEKQGFDCSGLVQHVFSETLDVDLPRRSVDMSRMKGKQVTQAELKTGDLVFFATNRRSREVNHVGVFVGNNRFVHAPRTGRNVSISRLDSPYWQKTFKSAKRVITPQLLEMAKADIH